MGRGNKEMSFSKGKREERQTGREGEGRERERERKLFLLQNLRLSCKYRHTGYKTKWKGQECGPCLPNENKIAPFFFFFYNMYKAHCKLVPQIHTKHTIFKKNRNRWEHGSAHWSLVGEA